ncbi:MAG: LysR family transcriptional regulator [Pseudomonadales bacterium]|nr:LysR family transcriptional regulator [Pseudomonadales bacterium]
MSIDKNIQDLLNFAAIVEQGSMTEAAVFLGSNKSSVSKKLVRLEGALGLQLMHREHKKLSLTDAGRSVYRQCQAITGISDLVSNEVESLKELPSGKVCINITSALGEFFNRYILPEFQQAYPDITIHMKVSDAIPDLNKQGFDITIRVMSSQYNDLVARKLADITSIMCAAPDYLNQLDTLPTPETLAQHNCLLWESEEHGVLKKWQLQRQRSDEIISIPVQGNFHCNHLPSLKAAVLSGRGIAYLPQYLIQEELDSGALIPLFTEYSNTTTALYALFPPHKQKPRKLQVLLDYLQQYFAGEEDFTKPVNRR